MNGKEDMNFKSEQESREERVLALLLDELDAEEAKSIEALLAEDGDLQVYRAGLERTLDLISESARAKADIDLEDFKLDPDRRRILEKLWTDKDSDSETEESGEAIRFPHGNESEDKSRSKLSRFLPMVAAAVVTFGAMGVIISSLIEQAEHEEDMALASEDASGAKQTEKPVLLEQSEKVREAGIGEENALTSIGTNLANADESDLLALTVIEESDKILTGRLVEDVVKLNAEAFAAADDIVVSSERKDPIVFEQSAGRQNSNLSVQPKELGLRHRAIEDELLDDLRESRPDLNVAIDSVAHSPSSGIKGSVDEVKSSLAVLDGELSATKKSAGAVRSSLEADTIDKRTASASGGVSGAGAGLLIASDESVAVSPKAVLKPKVNSGVPVAAPFALSASSSLQSKSNQKVDTLETVADRSSLFKGEIAVTENAPSVRVIDEFSKEISLNRAEAKGKIVEDASNPVDAPAGSAAPPREEVLGQVDYSYKNAKKIKREEEGLENFSSLHEAGAAPGAIAGEKGADKELLAFADFGLGGTDSKNPAALILSSSNGVPTYSGDGVAEAKVSVTASEGPGDASPHVSGDPTDSSQKGSTADPQAVPDSTLASGPDRWMVWTGLVLLGVAVFTVFRSRGKA